MKKPELMYYLSGERQLLIRIVHTFRFIEITKAC